MTDFYDFFDVFGDWGLDPSYVSDKPDKEDDFQDPMGECLEGGTPRGDTRGGYITPGPKSEGNWGP